MKNVAFAEGAIKTKKPDAQGIRLFILHISMLFRAF
jgi:hypothetical protein